MSRTVRTTTAVGVAVAALLGVSACSLSIASADLETNVANTLGEQIPGLGPVTCPDDLPGEVGKAVTCETSTADGQPIGAVVTVTSVEGATVNYNVSTEARPISKELLEKKIHDLLQPRLSTPIERSACNGELVAAVGMTQSCTIAVGGKDYRCLVTVKDVNGGLINFSVRTEP